MRPSKRELACALAALLVTSFGAQAQPPSGTPPAPPGMTPPPPGVNPQRKAGPDPHPQAAPQTAAGAVTGDAKATADAAYRVAQKACGAKTAADRDSCLEDARAAYDRALGRKEATPATPAPSAVPAGTKRK